MRNTARLLAALLSLTAAPALAQNLPANTVQGRLGIPAGGGPAQSIPFATLKSALTPTAPAVSIADFGAIPNDPTQCAVNRAAILRAMANPAVFVPPSTFYTDYLVVPSTVKSLEGESSAASRLDSTGCGAVAGNTLLTLGGDITISRLGLTTATTASSGNWALFSSGAYNIVIDQVDFIGRFGAEIDSAASLVIQNSSISSWRDYGFVLNDSNTIKISANRIADSIGNATLFSGIGILCTHCTDAIITGNTVGKTGSWGMVFNDGPGGVAHNITVSFNHISPNGIEGIGIQNVIGGSVVGNVVLAQSNQGDSCITVEGTTGNSVQYVTVSGNSVFNCGVNGIQLVTYVIDSTVTGNTIVNAGQNGAFVSASVALYGANVLRNNVTGNNSMCTASCPGLVHDYAEATSADFNMFQANRGTGGSSGLITLVGANSRALNMNVLNQSANTPTNGLNIYNAAMDHRWSLFTDTISLLEFVHNGNTTSRISFDPSGYINLPGTTSGAMQLRAAAASVSTQVITFPIGTTDFSATGGTSQVVKQTSAGGPFTVAQLAQSDISGTPTLATNSTNAAITNDTTTNAAMFPVWVTANTGNLPLKVTSTKLSFNPSTGALIANAFVLNNSSSGQTSVIGPASGNFTLTLPAATDTIVAKATTDTLTNKTFNTAGTGNAFTVNGVSLDTAWTSYTPTATSSSNTITTVSATGFYKQIGKTVTVRIEITITTNGTGSGKIRVTLPVAVAAGTISQALSGFNSTTGAVLSSGISPSDSTTQASIFTATAGYPGANATVLNVQGVYEVP